jgi:hypothetical protein
LLFHLQKGNAETQAHAFLELSALFCYRDTVATIFCYGHL